MRRSAPPAAAVLLAAIAAVSAHAQAKRVVIVKVDGVPAGIIEKFVEQQDPRTGRSMLPWIKHIFEEEGTWVRDFYVRGISLSAPSWSMLDTGQHAVIHGNAEYDRYAPRVYDYLNFFPFYVDYARSRRVDMPGVEVLDQAGIPLFIDSFSHGERFQSMQLFQRGVRWSTLKRTLQNRFFRSPRELLNEWQTGFEMSRGVSEQVERELISTLAGTGTLYLDYFNGDYDHVAHLTPDSDSQYAVLKQLDGRLGRIWNAIQASPLGQSTILVLVSDHGMTTEEGTYSQGYNLVNFFASKEGGGHHVLTNRHPMQMYKLRGLDPFVSEVITASSDSAYLKGRQEEYPTAQLDLDGNERAGIQLRNSNLNALQILFQALSSAGSDTAASQAIAHAALRIIDANRPRWSATVRDMNQELDSLRRAIARQRTRVEAEPARFTKAQNQAGLGDASRRLRAVLTSWEQDERGYSRYVRGMEALLDWKPGAPAPSVPPRVMGDPNTEAELRNYVVGPGPHGIVYTGDGKVDMAAGFRRIDYLSALTSIRVRNNVQAAVGPYPVDFVALRTPEGVLLCGRENRRLIIQSKTNEAGVLSLKATPPAGESWGSGYPLALFEDAQLAVPDDRAAWLSEWHTEREWLDATHRTAYSNAVIGLEEQFRHWKPDEVPAVFKRVADETDWPALLRLAERRRAAIDDDLLVLASRHWNFNVRSFNAGGNHGSFFRTSTRSVLMMAGAGVPKAYRIDRPYDSLSLVPTILALMGRTADAGKLPGPVIAEIAGQRSTIQASR